MFRYSLFTILMFATLVLQAQKEKFHDGTVITVSGDTLQGLIAFKKYSSPEDQVLYKKTESAPEQVYSWGQLSEVKDEDGKLELKVFNTTRNMEYVDGTDFSIHGKDSLSAGPVPLHPIYLGHKLSLYSLYDKGTFFFIYDGKELRQLIQKYRYLTQAERMFDYEKGRHFHITNEFKGVLAGYYDFVEDRKMLYILNNTLFEERALKYLVSRMDSKM